MRPINLELRHFDLLDQKVVQFEKLKQLYEPEDIAYLKAKYKVNWDEWKAMNLLAYDLIRRKTGLEQPKVQSWTNGWQLRSHFWARLRSAKRKEDATCISVLLNRKNLRIHLMWQSYLKERSTSTSQEYNDYIDQVEKWSSRLVDLSHYYIWTTLKGEYEEYQYTLLADYLSSDSQQERIQNELNQGYILQVGKIYEKAVIPNVEQVIAEAILELEGLYSFRLKT